MNYQGMMDGWHRDEYECHGHCGLCDECDDRYYQRCDEDYESSRDEELFN
jgi:hypothetical protein